MKLRSILFVLLAGLVVAPVFAIEIYRWVDENGVVHFSQTEPPGNDAGVKKMNLEDSTPSSYDPDQDRYNVEAQAEQMALIRAEMDKKRELAREQKLNTPQPPPVTQYQNAPYWQVPYYPGRPIGPRPPPRPEPPIERPYPTATLRPPGRLPD
jgi:hypothetical protein